MVGMVGIEPTRAFGPQDFKSCAYAGFATSPSRFARDHSTGERKTLASGFQRFKNDWRRSVAGGRSPSHKDLRRQPDTRNAP